MLPSGLFKFYSAVSPGCFGRQNCWKAKKGIWVLSAPRRTKRSQFSHKASLLLNNPKSIHLVKFFMMSFFPVQEYSWTLLEMKAPMSIWDYLVSWIVSLLLAPCQKQSGQSLPRKTFSSFLMLDIAHYQTNAAANKSQSLGFSCAAGKWKVYLQHCFNATSFYIDLFPEK